MAYLALIADLVSSRNLANRAEVQEQLQRLCQALNARRLANGMVSPMTLRGGDELQALFSRGDQLWACIAELEAGMQPVSMRFALGIGEISTPLDSRSALAMDGPAFQRAREAMQSMKKDGVRYRINGLVQSAALVQHSLDLLSGDRDKWKSTRHQVLAARLRGQRVDAIAEKLGVSEQAVYRNMRDASLSSVMALQAEIAQLIAASLKLEGFMALTRSGRG